MQFQVLGLHRSLLIRVFFNRKYCIRIRLNKVTHLAYNVDFQNQFFIKRDISWCAVLAIYFVTATAISSTPRP